MLPISPATIELVLGANGPLVSAGPVVTVEPRRRRFHVPVNMTVPAPRTTTGKQGKPASDGSKLHVLCSMTGMLAGCMSESVRYILLLLSWHAPLGVQSAKRGH